MNSGGNKPNILPSFQANLTRRLDELHIARVNINRDPVFLWENLDAFVEGSPEEIEKLLHDDFMKMRNDYDRTLAIKGVNDFERSRNIRTTQINLLIPRLRPLYRKTIEILDKKGYLVQIKGYGNIPTSNMDL